MDKKTFEALKRIMFGTIWKDIANAKKTDIFRIMEWIDEVEKEYTE